MLRIEVFESPEEVRWMLPPSKSHMIRWLVLAAQAEGPTELSFKGIPGQDVDSMVSCLEKMGARIEKRVGVWIVRGGTDGLHASDGTMCCGNSATTARIVTAISAGMNSTSTIDGDDSLRRRDGSALALALGELGCRLTSERLPCTVTGPVLPGLATLDQSSSSQPLTALLLASPNFPIGTEVQLTGEPVSRGYSNLTIDLCRTCGWSNDMDEGRISLSHWEVCCPDRVEIPEELSLLPMSILFDRLHGTSSLERPIQNGDYRIMEVIKSSLDPKGVEVDIRDASDVITPIVTLMALGNGGTITGAAHARGKESDRISTTAELLGAFGIKVKVTGNRISARGRQWPKSPERPVETHGDHRLAMTAVVLATAVGGTVLNPEVCSVTDPGFVEMITSRQNPSQ